VIDLASRAMALNFSWIEDGLVAGCRGPRTDEDLVVLRSLGVHALVRLAGEAETGLTKGDVEQNTLQDCYEFVPDMTAPSQKQIDRVIRFINRALTNKETVAVSCGAGCGRTGTILACYLVSRRLSAEAAIEKLIAIRPCSREIFRILPQKEAVFEFHRRMLKIQSRKEAI
jgi:atypical dual specificity phosphatase